MKNLKKILCMPDKALGAYLIQNLNKYYKNVETDKDNYIYARGPGEVCLVAHIDTVRRNVDEPVMLSVTRNIIRNVKGVLGADDRAGVYGILEVIKTCVSCKIPLPSVLFTNYEESGGVGVRKFIATKKFQSEGLKLLVELDRKGCNEYVFYSATLPKPIKDYVESFGFKEERGSYSDIADLTNEYSIPSVNLSVGYYLQHTNNERLHYDELLMTIDRVVDICSDPPDKLHTVEKPTYQGWKGHHSSYSYGGDYYSYNRNANKAHEATKCAGTTSSAANVPAKQPELSFEGDIARKVSHIILNLKDDIRTELTTVFSLDTVAQRFISHEHNVEIIKMLQNIEDTFIIHVTYDKPVLICFTDTWDELITSAFYKSNPKTASAAVISC